MGVPLWPRTLHAPTSLPDWTTLTTLSLELAPEPGVIERILEQRHRARDLRVRAGWGLCGQITSRLKNPSIAQFADVSFPELADYVADLVARSHWYHEQTPTVPDARHQPVAGRHAARDRRYNQLPCTLDTVRYRVEEIRRHAAADDPILVLGDDDLLSVALARAGFSDVTALDIDPRVISQIRQLAGREGLRVQAQVYDLRAAPPPRRQRQQYKLVFFDPVNTSDGVRSFLETAVAATSRPDAVIFANLHLISLFPRGLRALDAALRHHGLEVQAFHPAVSAYPTSALAQLASRALAASTGLLLGDLPALTGPALSIRYFVADGLVLARGRGAGPFVHHRPTARAS